MSFRTDMQAMAVDLINNVFGTEGEVSQTVTIMRPTLMNIDEITGKMYKSIEEFEVLGIVGPWEKDAVNPQVSEQAIKVNDLKLIVAWTDLQWLPTADLDTVSLQDGSICLIVSTTTDAAQAAMTMQIRRVKGSINV